MGCPNLPLDPKNPEGEKGAIFVAVKGQGAFQVSLLRSRRLLRSFRDLNQSPS